MFLHNKLLILWILIEDEVSELSFFQIWNEKKFYQISFMEDLTNQILDFIVLNLDLFVNFYVNVCT